ncbi:unnamed protein product [Echinostoma caproni]|uniref:UDENN domain-containing protein n=1 Tax=Echinostoma caproni TaxID=27848 RepID=A0A183AAG7_9TREM|nr:unnamed protein product [Echinostoma caproni]
MPKDVWLANLDTQEALSTLPSITSNPTLDLALHQVNQLFRNPSTKTVTGYNPLAFISDEASTSVATRVSMVLFLLTKNILGGLSEYTRTLRLYPRPVVAFQFERFMRSRPRPCLFTSMLAKTQAVEFFAEYSLCSQNEAFQRIEAGDYTPELIGDKAEWFSSLLQAVYFDVWPDTVVGSPSPCNQSNTYPGSPLLYALVAARLQYNSQFINFDDPDASGLSVSDLRSDGMRDDLSDYPTEPQNKLIVTKGVRPDTDIPGTIGRDSDPTPMEQIFVRAGEPLPPSLADYFNPPLKPVVEAQSPIGVNGAAMRTSIMQKDDISADDVELEKDSTNSTMSDTPSDSSRPFKPTSPSTGQTLRALVKMSTNMFNTSPNRELDGENPNQSVLSDGRINWNASVFVLLSELLRSNGVDQSAELTRALNKRNLLLARLNLNNANTTSGADSSVSQSHMTDVPVDSWSQYKALVWVLRQIAQGLEVSLRSEVFIPTQANVHSEAYMSGRVRSPVTNDDAFRGGLASAFVLLEIAHTHYYQLPERNGRTFLTMGRASVTTLDMGKLSQTNSRPASPAPSEQGQGNRKKKYSMSLESEENIVVHPEGTSEAVPDGQAFSTRFPILLQNFWNKATTSEITETWCEIRRQLHESSSKLSTATSSFYNTVSLLHRAGIADSDGDSLTPHPPDLTRSLRIRTTSLTSSPDGRPLRTSHADSPNGAQKRLLSVRPPQARRTRASESRTPRQEILDSSDSNTVFEFPADPSALRSRTPEPYSSTRSPRLDDMDSANLTTNKSSQSRGYRYRRSHLLAPNNANPEDARRISPDRRHRRSLGDVQYMRWNELSNGDNNTNKPIENRIKVGRTFVFEDLTSGAQTRSRLWDNLQFWEDAFLDAVAQERDMLGMDFRPTELLARYNLASPLKRKHSELEEDRLLAGLMHNLIAFMDAQSNF